MCSYQLFLGLHLISRLLHQGCFGLLRRLLVFLQPLGLLLRPLPLLLQLQGLTGLLLQFCTGTGSDMRTRSRAVGRDAALVPFWALCVCSSICLSLSISSSFSRSIRSFSFSACSRFFFSFSSCALVEQKPTLSS